mgnify:CR=1 FL=1
MALLQISEPGKSLAPHQRRIAVGIDLGTTNSLIAIIHPESKQPVALKEFGQHTLVPSVIYFDSNENIVVGDESEIRGFNF